LGHILDLIFGNRKENYKKQTKKQLIGPVEKKEDNEAISGKALTEIKRSEKILAYVSGIEWKASSRSKTASIGHIEPSGKIGLKCYKSEENVRNS